MAKIRKEHLNCLENSESEKIINQPKYYDQDIDWKKANNVNYIESIITPYDDNDDLKGTIPGVTIQINYKAPIRIKSSSKTLITLFKLKSGTKKRAYQIEASAEDKISCRDGFNLIYGCHEHVGKKVFKVKKLYEIEDIPRWFDYFCDKVKLQFTGKINSINEE